MLPADTGPPFLRLPEMLELNAIAAITAPIPIAAAPPNEPIEATMAAGVHATVVAAADDTLAAVVVAVPATAADVVAAVAASRTEHQNEAQTSRLERFFTSGESL